MYKQESKCRPRGQFLREKNVSGGHNSIGLLRSFDGLVRNASQKSEIIILLSLT